MGEWSAKAPRPEPRTRPIFGRRAVRDSKYWAAESAREKGSSLDIVGTPFSQRPKARFMLQSLRHAGSHGLRRNLALFSISFQTSQMLFLSFHCVLARSLAARNLSQPGDGSWSFSRTIPGARGDRVKILGFQPEAWSGKEAVLQALPGHPLHLGVGEVIGFDCAKIFAGHVGTGGRLRRRSPAPPALPWLI